MICCMATSRLLGHAQWATVGYEASRAMYFSNDALPRRRSRSPHCQHPCGMKAGQVPYAQVRLITVDASLFLKNPNYW